MESARRIRILFSIATTNALFQCYIILKHFARFCLPEFAVETTIVNSGNLEERLADASRGHTLCFRVPVPGQLYIELTEHSYSAHICDQNRHCTRLLHFEFSIRWESNQSVQKASNFRHCEQWRRKIESPANLIFKRTQSQLSPSFQHHDETAWNPMTVKKHDVGPREI